jgi:hypothetical protein
MSSVLPYQEVLYTQTKTREISQALNNVVYQRHDQQHAYTLENHIRLATEAAKSLDHKCNINEIIHGWVLTLSYANI